MALRQGLTDRLLRSLHERPGMFGLDGSFGSYVNYLTGYEAASPGSLVGFREWLVARAEGGTNLGWPGLVKMLVLPEDDRDMRETLDAQANDAIVRALFELLGAFLDERDGDHSHSVLSGLARIYVSYADWLGRQDWYPCTDVDQEFEARRKRTDST
jgi:hypothetical protein